MKEDRSRKQASSRLRRVLLIWATLILCNSVSISFSQDLHSRFERLGSENTSIQDSHGMDISFNRISVDQGLPTSTVYSIFQDSRGFMWFGTTAGLCRYDGHTFKVYDPTPIYAGSMFVEDARGSIWFIPAGGELHRLNVITESVTRYHIGLGHRTYLIFKDAADDIWVGTKGDGLAKYVPSADSFLVFTHDPANSASICNDSVYAICQDKQRNLWIGTAHGMDRCDSKEGVFLHSDQLGGNWIRSIIQAKDSTLWLGTDDGLCKFDASTGNLERYRNKVHERNLIHSVHATGPNEVWLAAGTLIERFDNITKAFRVLKGSYSDEPMRAGNGTDSILFDDRKQRRWVVTSAGLALFDRRDETLKVFKPNSEEPHAIPEGYITAITEDNAGNLWFGTQTGGVCFLDHMSVPFQHVSQYPFDKIHLTNASVSAIVEESAGIVWVGSHDGLDRLNLSTGALIHYEADPTAHDSLKDGRILALLEDSSGIIWIGTSGGLCRLNTATGKFAFLEQNAEHAGLSASQEIVSICIDAGGTMWLGGGIGSGLLERFDRSTCTFNNYYFCGHRGYSGMHSNPIGTILEDREHILWFAGLGLGVFDRKNGQVRYFRHDPKDASSLGSDNVSSLCEDRTGNLWVGLETGLDQLDRTTGRFTHVSVRDGLASEMIYNLIEDNCGSTKGMRGPGNLWLATPRGISRFNPVTREIRNYGPAEGVPIAPSEFVHCCFRSRDGHLYFGGTDGFVRFHPDDVRDNQFIPPIVITSFKKFNVEANLDSAITQKKTIELVYSEKVISFEFAALNFTHPDKNEFAYQMEGFDSEWVYCGTQRSVMYTNLHPGTYTFRVKGSNNDGVWNEQGTSVAVIITPPWWKTKLAYCLYALAFVIIVYLGWRIQMRRMDTKHALEMAEFEAKKLHEVDEMKSRFFTNISHEFRTPLTLILGPVKQIADTIEDEKTKDELKIVHRNARRLLQLVNQLLDISRLESGSMQLHAVRQNIISLLRAFVSAFSSYAERKKITLRFNTTDDEIIAFVDKEIIEKTISNILSNALKFTPEGGLVEVSVTKNEEQADVQICDTGIGIPKDEIPKIFDRFYQVDGSHTRAEEGTGIGLALAKELIELHKCKIRVESELGKGTTVTVSIPLGTKHLRPEEMSESIQTDEEVYHTEAVSGSFVEERTGRASIVSIPGGKKATVLIVEDNDDMRRYIGSNLEEEYAVLEAKDGEEGWNKSTEYTPDMIVTDVMMPKMDGFELCRRIKTDERTSHIPVIILTAKAAGSDKMEGLETGADDYILKPFEHEELKTRIRNLIEQRHRIHEHFRKKGILELDEVEITPVDRKFLEKVFHIIEENIPNTSFSVESLAEMGAVSRAFLHKKVVSLTGEPPVELIRRMRLTRAAEMLEKKGGNISEIALEVGFSNPAYFSECFKKQFGVSPSKYPCRSVLN
jgi:signal transduction histidine kinase/ligand-binding sensor domain-containing protein/DNA-binding response OmpR family regulator